MQATTETVGPTVLLRLAMKSPDAVGYALNHEQPTEAQAAVIEQFVKYGEYLTVEFMSDGTARVVPVSDQD